MEHLLGLRCLDAPVEDPESVTLGCLGHLGRWCNVGQ